MLISYTNDSCFAVVDEWFQNGDQTGCVFSVLIIVFNRFRSRASVSAHIFAHVSAHIYAHISTRQKHLNRGLTPTH